MIDWPAIEADFRAGLTVLAIARRHEVSPSTIYRRAAKGGWTSPPPQPVPCAPKPPTQSDELAQLRVLAATLRERLGRVMEGHTPYGVVLGARESPAALLLKLCQISEKIITIERRLAGAGDPTSTQLSEHDRDILDRFKRRYGVH